MQEESAKYPPQSSLVHSSFAHQQSLESLVLILLSSIGLLDSGSSMWFALACAPALLTDSDHFIWPMPKLECQWDMLLGSLCPAGNIFSKELKLLYFNDNL